MSIRNGIDADIFLEGHLHSVADQRDAWRRIALYLADCHAATAQHEGQLSRTSASSRRRMRYVCEVALEAIERGDVERPQPHGYEQAVLDRLRRAATGEAP